MPQTSFLSTTNQSVLLGQSHLKPQNGNLKRKVAGLMLTSLVDAFSILVIYLLFGPSMTGESISPEYGVNLPLAYRAELADKETTIIVKNHHYYLQNQEIESNHLLSELQKISLKLKEQPQKALVIVADKSNDIEQINPILIAASEAGMNQLRLAVEQMGD